MTWWFWKAELYYDYKGCYGVLQYKYCIAGWRQAGWGRIWCHDTIVCIVTEGLEDWDGVYCNTIWCIVTVKQESRKEPGRDTEFVSWLERSLRHGVVS